MKELKIRNVLWLIGGTLKLWSKYIEFPPLMNRGKLLD